MRQIQVLLTETVNQPGLGTCMFNSFQMKSVEIFQILIALLAGSVEGTDCTSAEG